MPAKAMPFFKYQGLDASGQRASGSLDATDAATARDRLTRLGLRQVTFDSDPPQVGQPPVVPPRGRQPQVAPAPISSGPRLQPVHRVADTPVRVPQSATVTCPIQSNRHRSLFFDQMARFLTAGVPLTRAFSTLASQNGGVRASFLSAAGAGVARGESLFDVFAGGYITEAERAALAAAERGGYLPEACARLSELATSAYRMNRTGIYPLLMLGFGALFTPILKRIQDGALRSIELQNAADGRLPRSLVFSEIGKGMPLAILQGGLLLGLGFFLHWLWMRPGVRPLRHSLSARWIVLRSRARSEATAQIAFHLSRLAAAGIAASESARLAAATPPNLHLREDATRAMGNLVPGASMVAAVGGTRLFSDSYRHMVENAEMTGDLPGALETVSRTERAEDETKSKNARALIGTLLVVSSLLVGGVLAGVFWSNWYSQLIKILTQDP